MYYNSPKHGKVLINSPVLSRLAESSLKTSECKALFEVAYNGYSTTGFKGYVRVSTDLYVAAIHKDIPSTFLTYFPKGGEAIFNKLKETDCVVYRAETQEAAFLNDSGELTVFELDQDVLTAEVGVAGVTNISDNQGE